jgi:hypothetical protein
MIYFLSKDGEKHPIVIVFPRLFITTDEFKKAGEGKKTCLLFVCNARLISMELLMEENGVDLWWSFVRWREGRLCFGISRG